MVQPTNHLQGDIMSIQQAHAALAAKRLAAKEALPKALSNPFFSYSITRAPGGTWVVKTWMHEDTLKGIVVYCTNTSDEHDKFTCLNKVADILAGNQ